MHITRILYISYTIIHLHALTLHVFIYLPSSPRSATSTYYIPQHILTHFNISSIILTLYLCPYIVSNSFSSPHGNPSCPISPFVLIISLTEQPIRARDDPEYQPIGSCGAYEGMAGGEWICVLCWHAILSNYTRIEVTFSHHGRPE